MNELSRQAVHFSSLAFVLLAPFAGRLLISGFFLAVAFAFLAYSLHLRRLRKNWLSQMLDAVSSFFLDRFERKSAISFMGAFWLFFSYGITFLLFPMAIALASCSILAVSDSISTIVGTSFGRHKTIGGKSLEGSMAFFISAFMVSLFFLDLRLSLAAAGVATIAEMLPDLGYFRSLRKRELVDDNLMIPLVTSLLIYFAAPYL
jgi:dolichol kinase